MKARESIVRFSTCCPGDECVWRERWQQWMHSLVTIVDGQARCTRLLVFALALAPQMNKDTTGERSSPLALTVVAVGGRKTHRRSGTETTRTTAETTTVTGAAAGKQEGRACRVPLVSQSSGAWHQMQAALKGSKSPCNAGADSDVSENPFLPPSSETRFTVHTGTLSQERERGEGGRGSHTDSRKTRTRSSVDRRTPVGVSRSEDVLHRIPMKHSSSCARKVQQQATNAAVTANLRLVSSPVIALLVSALDGETPLDRRLSR